MKQLCSIITCLIFSGNLFSQMMMNIYENNGTVLHIPLASIDSITYTMNPNSNLPTLTTLPVTNITTTSATGGGDVTSDGGSPVTARGIVWSIYPTPTGGVSTGSGLGSYTSNLTGLMPGIGYYVRAFATNSSGTAYGNQVVFTALHNPIFTQGVGATDIDGNIYTSVIIGSQEWLVENLKTTRYCNGDPIQYLPDSLQWMRDTVGAWCYYDNDSSNNADYGKLYNGYVAVDARNACPCGWHPGTYELVTLFNTVGDSLNSYTQAGSALKETGNTHWQNAFNANNCSGFTALPGGMRHPQSGFSSKRQEGFWWQSSGQYMYLIGGNSQLFFSSGGPRTLTGCSIRCLKD